MQCISCKVEINPQWSHAIDINVCPFCGKEIMDRHLKNLFTVLRETMTSLQDYPSQLNDWMLANHSYIKTTSEDIVNFIPKDILVDLKKVKDDKDFQERKKFVVKVKNETGDIEEVQAETLQSEEQTNDFFKRAEVIRTPNANAPKNPKAQTFNSPVEKTKHLKEMAKQIKKAGTSGLTASGEDIEVSEELLQDADPEAFEEFQSMISGGGITSSLSDIDDEEVPSHILAANQALASKKTGSSSNAAADLAKLRQMQDRVKNSNQAFQTGENRGKGGFSRS
jgi:Zn-finger nucleic acid-binding protein